MTEGFDDAEVVGDLADVAVGVVGGVVEDEGGGRELRDYGEADADVDAAEDCGEGDAGALVAQGLEGGEGFACEDVGTAEGSNGCG